MNKEVEEKRKELLNRLERLKRVYKGLKLGILEDYYIEEVERLKKEVLEVKRD